MALAGERGENLVWLARFGFRVPVNTTPLCGIGTLSKSPFLSTSQPKDLPPVLDTTQLNRLNFEEVLRR